MKCIEGYEIIHHGVENSQYFQGCGVCGTEYTDVATGIGYSERAALDDAMVQLALADWDVDGNIDLDADLKAASDDNKITPIIKEYCDGGDPENCECDTDLQVFVSVRVR